MRNVTARLAGRIGRMRMALAAALCACGIGCGLAQPAIRLQPVLQGLSSPLFATHAGDGSDRIFVVEQGGRILVLAPGATTPSVFLDINARVLAGGEQGLLGLAFHPQFATNGRFFVDYTRNADGATVIAEYHADPGADVAGTAEIPLLTIAQPFANHNGGMLAFGPDGMLYIGMGDGGSGNDPGNRAQNVDELLGKILRIDVDHPANGLPYSSPAGNPYAGATPGRDEIFAIGLRNPFRFSFDRVSGQLFVGDVGQSLLEEIDVVTAGGNFGWRVYEGTNCTGLDPTLCNPAPFVFPIAQYDHGGGRCSVTGGYVYRGPRHTLPQGTYVFGDFCTGEIFRLQGGGPALLLDTAQNVSSFGEDQRGELYVAGLGGSVLRIARAVHDLDGDARSDVGWRNANGTNVVWSFGGAAPTPLSTIALPSAASSWQASFAHDVDGDGSLDIVWRNAANGLVAIWFMNRDGSIARAAFPATVPVNAGWQLAAVADIDGDGRAELVWRNVVTGALVGWQLDPAGAVAGTRDFGTVPLGFDLRGAGDFDGDGTDDLLWFDAATGQVALYLMHASAPFTAAFPGSVGPGTWRPLRVADYDGDGKADILWRDEATGTTAVWYLDSGRLLAVDFLPAAPATEWSVGSTGDFDADGRVDVAWQAFDGTVVRWMMKGRHVAPVIETLPGVGGGWNMIP